MYHSLQTQTTHQKFKFILIATALIHGAIIFYRLGGRELILSTGQSSESLSVRVLLQQALKKPTPVTKKKIKKKKITKTKSKTPKKVAPPIEETTTETQSSQKVTPEQAFESLILDFTQPNYPRLALRRGITGLVILNLFIRNDGSIDRVLVSQSSGNDLLDNSALRAAKQWRFKALGPDSKELTVVQKRIVYKIN